MTIGFVMLVHQSLERAAQVARHWATHGCPVVIHVDLAADPVGYEKLVSELKGIKNVQFSPRYRCEWGGWGLVLAAQTASELLLSTSPKTQHVFLASGSCLPLRPVKELQSYLDDRPDTDFIESVTTSDALWTVGGLDQERFKFRFPFSWKKHRNAFDSYVYLQRKFGVARQIPDGIKPHLGSQWWCLTRRTLSAILQDPNREKYDRYFSKVWIPDESYFQTMVRRHSSKIESRSLTLSNFDYQGKPHNFYDDHLQLLRGSDCFVARKIWPNADRLYDVFLAMDGGGTKKTEPNPTKIDRIFSKAVERRTQGRPGLYMQSRFPKHDSEKGLTSEPYSVFEGFSDVFDKFEHWLDRAVGCRVHGNIFDPERVEFSRKQRIFSGALSDSAALRDYNPRGFLTNLIWNTRGERQCFQFGPRDNQEITRTMAMDTNAQISVISGAWALTLFHQNKDFAVIRKEAARLQKIENRHLEILRSNQTKARVRIWTLAEFLESPISNLQTVIDEIGARKAHNLTEVPELIDMRGFGQFLQNLRNQGMQPYLMGDFSVEQTMSESQNKSNKPYLVK